MLEILAFKHVKLESSSQAVSGGNLSYIKILNSTLPWYKRTQCLVSDKRTQCLVSESDASTNSCVDSRAFTTIRTRRFLDLAHLPKSPLLCFIMLCLSRESGGEVN